MSENKYKYLFDKNNVITHYSDAVRGAEYCLKPGDAFEYTYNSGTERHYFTTKNKINDFYIAGPGGESVEHSNAKLEIAHEKKYYDTIFKQWIEFYKIVPEFYHDIKKRPDLSCYNENNILVCCIEICFSNAKSNEDIEKLKNLKVPIIEIYIKDDNRCKHIILPEILESNRSKFTAINFKLREFEQEEFKLETEYNQVAEQLQKGLSRITTDLKYFEINFKGENKRKIDKFDNWLQKRLNFKKSGIDFEEEIRKFEIRNSKDNQFNEVVDYGIGKQEKSITELTKSIDYSKHAFNEIAKNCKIEWFRNNWMTHKTQNLIQEINYWLS